MCFVSIYFIIQLSTPKIEMACILGGKVGRHLDASCQFSFQQNVCINFMTKTDNLHANGSTNTTYKYRKQIMQKSDDKLVVS